MAAKSSHVQPESISLVELEERIKRTYSRVHELYRDYDQATRDYDDVLSQSNEMMEKIQRQTGYRSSYSAEDMMKQHPVYMTRIKSSLELVQSTLEKSELIKEEFDSKRNYLMSQLQDWNARRISEEGEQSKVVDLTTYRIWKRYSHAFKKISQ